MGLLPALRQGGRVHIDGDLRPLHRPLHHAVHRGEHALHGARPARHEPQHERDAHQRQLLLHRHLRRGGRHEDDGHEPQVLLPGGLEHLRLHHRRPLPLRARRRHRDLGPIRPQIIPSGNKEEIG